MARVHVTGYRRRMSLRVPAFAKRPLAPERLGRGRIGGWAVAATVGALMVGACDSDGQPRFAAGRDGGLLDAAGGQDASADAADTDASQDAQTDAASLDAPRDGSLSDATDVGSADAAAFEAILAGDRPAEEVFAEIANNGGFPVHAGSEWIFAIRDDGAGPYRLAGDFNDWAPEVMKLDQGVYWVRRAVQTPAGAKYKFVNPAETYAPDPVARAYGFDEFGEFSLVRGPGAHLERWLQQSDGTVTPRRVRVWVPAGQPTRHLYVQDGQNLFNPAAPFGGWALQQQLGSETLAIGIDNTPSRFDEYTQVVDSVQGQQVGGRADEYLAFVHQWLRPRIQTRYGTPSRVGMLGSSLGGLVSLYAALAVPGAFDFVGSLSGTVGWGSRSASNPTLIDLFRAAAPQPVRIYIDSGGGAGSGCVDSDADGIEDDGDGSDNYCENRQLLDVLAGRGFPSVTADHVPGAPHNEAAWAARVAQPIAVFEAP